MTPVSLEPAKANDENNQNLKYKYLINTANEYFCKFIKYFYDVDDTKRQKKMTSEATGACAACWLASFTNLQLVCSS